MDERPATDCCSCGGPIGKDERIQPMGTLVVHTHCLDRMLNDSGPTTKPEEAA